MPALALTTLTIYLLMHAQVLMVAYIWSSHLKKRPQWKFLELSIDIEPLDDKTGFNIPWEPKWVWSRFYLSQYLGLNSHPSTADNRQHLPRPRCTNNLLLKSHFNLKSGSEHLSPSLTCPLALSPWVAHLGKAQALLDRWRAAPDWVPAASQAAPRVSRQPPSLSCPLQLHTRPNSTLVTTCAQWCTILTLSRSLACGC